MVGPVYLITGSPAAGKSTTSVELMRRYQHGVHVEIDRIRDAVVQGYADPCDEWTDETYLQFGIARSTAFTMARLFRESGYAVCIDDVAMPHEIESLFQSEFSDLRIVVLLPKEQTAVLRNRTRTNKLMDPEGITHRIVQISDAFHRSDKLDRFLVIDTTELTPSQVVDQIVQNQWE